jgi:hypothetical protein
MAEFLGIRAILFDTNISADERYKNIKKLDIDEPGVQVRSPKIKPCFRANLNKIYICSEHRRA